MNTRVRFAPSPTGSLHLGSVRTAIFNYLFSKQTNGSLILRIEDTDKERSTNHSQDEILSSLKWLGIQWNEGPYLQSERIAIYQNYANILLSEGKAYKCFSSQEEIDRIKEQAKKEKKIYKYPRIWRDRKDHPQNKDFVIRFKTPDNKIIDFKDTLRGKIEIESNNLDDFIIIKSDGFPTYNFASAIDDIEMKITNVIRGEDHLSNTPKQILIYNSLNAKIPDFTHVSMILGKDKTKLSKRHGAESIDNFKSMGFLPVSIINYLARLGWSFGDQEIFSLNEMEANFSLDNLNKSPAIFDLEKFTWVNSNQIKKADTNYLKELINFKFIEGIDIDLAILSAKEKSKDLIQLKEVLNFCETKDLNIDDKSIESINDCDKKILEKFLNSFMDYNFKNMDEIEDFFKNFLLNNNLKMKNLAFPLRLILTGSKNSPGIYQILKILSKELISYRVKRFL